MRIHHSLENSTTFQSKSFVLSKMQLLLTTPSIFVRQNGKLPYLPERGRGFSPGSVCRTDVWILDIMKIMHIVLHAYIRMDLPIHIHTYYRKKNLQWCSVIAAKVGRSLLLSHNSDGKVLVKHVRTKA